METNVQLADGMGNRTWLDRPLIPGLRLSRWAALCIALALVIAFTRLWDLGSRSYSHDESIHAWESWRLATGQGYTHSPVYHGPFLYHITALMFLIFGDTDVTGRLATSLAGIAIALAPLAMRKWLGKHGVLAAMFLMAISPVLMHRARYIRHDQFAILFNLVLIVAVLRYLEKPRTLYLNVVAAALALGFAAKETTFITYAIVGTFLVALLAYEWLPSAERSLASLMARPSFDLIVLVGTIILPFASPLVIAALGHDPLDYTGNALLFSLGIALVMFGIGAGIGMWWDPRRWMTCAGLFWAIFLPFFTTMFTNGSGIATGVIGQLGYWLSQQGESRGGQPWHYYLVLTVMYEFLPALLALGGALYYASRRSARVSEPASDAPTVAPFVPFVIYWLAAAFVVYSWAGEKMPWLMQHISVPMTLLAGWTLGRLLKADWREIARRKGLVLLGLVPLEIWLLVRLATLSPSTDTSTEALTATMMWIVALVMGLGIALLMANLLSNLARRDAWRMLALSCISILAVLTIRTALRLTFVNGDSATELLVYAQGAPDAGIIARDLDAMSYRLTGGLHLKVAHDSETSWPFVWYLRNYDKATYYAEAPSGPLDADVVLVGTGNESATVQFLGDNYVRREYRLVWWPYQDWYMQMTPASLWEDLTTAEGRTELWNILFYRKWDRDVTDWPYVSRFAMYVNRNVLQSLWDAGPEALTAASAAEPNTYLEHWSAQTALWSYGSSGSGQGQLLAPKGIAVDSAGNVYVADSQNNRIQVFDSNGVFLRQWGTLGAGPGDFQEPWGIAIAPDDTVYVADTWNHRIEVFTTQGEYLREWGTYGETGAGVSAATVFYGPRGLAVDSAGNLFVSDTGNKRVCKFSPDGELLASIGGAGTAPGQFEEPVGLAVGPDDRLYVADTWNKRIQVFSDDLVYESEWDIRGWSSLSVVNKPYLAIDDAGIVWTTDPETYRVLGFADGEIVSVFGQYGSSLDGMNLPTGICSAPGGILYVTDSDNNRVLAFSPTVDLSASGETGASDAESGEQ